MSQQTKHSIAQELRNMGLDERMMVVFAAQGYARSKREPALPFDPFTFEAGVFERGEIDENGKFYMSLDVDPLKQVLEEHLPKHTRRSMLNLALNEYKLCTFDYCESCKFRKVCGFDQTWCLVCHEEVTTVEECGCEFEVLDCKDGSVKIIPAADEHCLAKLDGGSDILLVIRHCMASGSQKTTETHETTESHEIAESRKNTESHDNTESHETTESHEIAESHEPRLAQKDYDLPCDVLAKSLIGKVINRKLDDGTILSGRIVETEAYMGFDDPACHTYRGKRTKKVESMYGKPGTLYVYSIHGKHCCNISSRGEGAAVLIRAIEPIEGEDYMMRIRQSTRKTKVKRVDIGNGPGKLCQAMEISKCLDGADMCVSKKYFISPGTAVPSDQIGISGRVGIHSYGEEAENMQLRFFVKNNPFVSRF